MKLRTLLTRWFKRPAADARARAKWGAIIYYDGPRTKWRRAQRANHFEQHPGGLRIALPRPSGELMPEPHADDILQRRDFRSNIAARIWVLARLRGFDTTKMVGEVRPL